MRTVLIYSLFLIAGLVQCACAQQDDAERLERLRDQMAALQSELDTELIRHNETMAAVAEIDRELSAIQKELQTNQSQILFIDTELKALRKSEIETQQALALQMSQLSEFLIRGYPLKDSSGLELLLNQDKARHVSRMMAYQKILTQSYFGLIETMTNTLESLQDTQNSLASRQLALEQLALDRERSQASLAKNKTLKTKTLAELSKSIEDKEVGLAVLQEDEQRLLRILEVAKESQLQGPTTYEDMKELRELRGELPMPVVGSIRTQFGAPREGNARWRGWVIETNEDASIRAIGPGQVVYADWLRGYGLMIIVDHQDGLYSLYAHNGALFFQVGDWVRSGEVISLAGQPTAPELTDIRGVYLEIRENGQPVDPKVWIDPNQATNPLRN